MSSKSIMIAMRVSEATRDKLNSLMRLHGARSQSDLLALALDVLEKTPPERFDDDVVQSQIDQLTSQLSELTAQFSALNDRVDAIECAPMGLGEKKSLPVKLKVAS